MRTQRPFHEQLDMLELEVLDLGGLAERALVSAVAALSARDESPANRVIYGDDEIDLRYFKVEERALQILALQGPVAVDLRVVSAVTHVNFHLERVGDIAVNIAKIAKATREMPTRQEIVSSLDEMCEIVRTMIRVSVDAFARRDLARARSLTNLDDPVDLLNKMMYQKVADCAVDLPLLEWAVRMLMVSRQIERAGDHAVDIGEQVSFLVTGEFREFTDSSHPEVES